MRTCSVLHSMLQYESVAYPYPIRVTRDEADEVSQRKAGTGAGE